MIPMTDRRPGHHHLAQVERLARLSAQIEELFSRASSSGDEIVAPDLADEIAAAAGEIMLALAGDEEDELVRGALDDARRLREVARTLSPVRTRLGEAGAALARDVSLIIRHDKLAA
jgi:cell division septum initiation protein DivIVA